jgi:dTDP-4-dehydrorhamnose reductase
MNDYFETKVMQSNILITGATGFIGKALFARLITLNPIGTYFTTKPEFADGITVFADLREEATVRSLFDEYKPSVIFHLAALVSPLANEQNPLLAVESNLRITENILKYCKPTAHVIFLSTDKVFDGSVCCPDEVSPTCPSGLYGQLKWQCERLIQKHAERHHIFRLPIVHDMGNTRSKSFVDKSLSNLKSGNKVTAFANVKRCYVRVNQLVEILQKSGDDINYGVYHVGSQLESYFERIRKLCEEENVDYEGLLEIANGDVFPLEQDLDTSKAQNVFEIKFN